MMGQNVDTHQSRLLVQTAIGGNSLTSYNEVFLVVEQLATVMLQCKSMTLTGTRESVSRVIACLRPWGVKQFTTIWIE